MFIPPDDERKLRRIMANERHSQGPVFRPSSTSTQTTSRSRGSELRNSITQYPSFTRIPVSEATRRDEKNRPGCTCFLKNRNGKSIPTPVESETTRSKPAVPGPKKTCTRCYTRRETMIAGYDRTEPYNEPESPARLDDAKQSRIKTFKSSNRWTPEQVMTAWIPGRERPKDMLFTPNENYVDVSPEDFSLRKYLPEYFLDEAEQSEIRAKYRQAAADAVAQGERSEDSKCLGGCYSPMERRDAVSDQDWKTIIESTADPSPCLWSDGEIALARERDELTEEELKPRPKTPSNPSFDWSRWSCGNWKRKKSRKRDKE